MSAKGTTWKIKGEKRRKLNSFPEDERLPEWAYKLISALSDEVTLLRERNEKLQNELKQLKISNHEL